MTVAISSEYSYEGIWNRECKRERIKLEARPHVSKITDILAVVLRLPGESHGSVRIATGRVDSTEQLPEHT